MGNIEKGHSFQIKKLKKIVIFKLRKVETNEKL